VTLHLAILVAAATSSSALDYRALVDEYRRDSRPQVEQLLAVPAADRPPRLLEIGRPFTGRLDAGA
jgi:hypothetical protein